MTAQDWNLHALERAFTEHDLPACQTSHERVMARAIHGIGMRKRAEELRAQGKLTPCQRAIAEKYGFA